MKIKQLKIINQDQSTEIADIGADAVNIDYNDTNVKLKLDELSNNVDTNTTNISNEIAIRANAVTNLQSQINGLASGSPKGSYANAAAIVTANPDTGVYIAQDNGHIYSWTKNGSNVIDLGVYQAAELERKSISYPLLDTVLQDSFNPVLDNQITTYSLSNHTWYGWSTLNPSSDNAITSYFYPVNKGELYYVKGSGAFYNRRGAVLVDSELKRVDGADVQPALDIHPQSAIDTDGFIYVDTTDAVYLSALSSIKVYKIGKFESINLDAIRNDINNLQKVQYIDYASAAEIGITKWNGATGTNAVNNGDGTFDLTLVANGSVFAGYKLNNAHLAFEDNNEHDSITAYVKFTIANASNTPKIGLAMHFYANGSVYKTKQETLIINSAGTYEIVNTYKKSDLLGVTPASTNIFIVLNEFNKTVELTLEDFCVTYDEYTHEDINKDAFRVVSDIKGSISNLENDINDIEEEIDNLETNPYVKVDNNKIVFSNEAERLIDEQLKNDFAWKPFDAVYATMTFDDTNNDISTLEALAAELDIPMCWATIPSKLDNVVASGQTARTVLTNSVARGSEVLAHWGPYLKHDSTAQDYYNVYVGAKKTLENAGFEVNGIITAGGGTGSESYQTQDFVLDTKIARCYYQYADLTSHFDNSIEQFKNSRTFTDSGVQATKNYIDQVVAQGSGWINWASHGIQSQYISSIDGFREIWEYALSKGVVFTTWKYLYDNFKSSKLEKRIKLLENNTN